jgi:hypothetical protein
MLRGPKLGKSLFTPRARQTVAAPKDSVKRANRG